MKNHYRLPDFIIAGAMKCGTSTLHNILNHHPDIYIPDSEIHFFDMDDIKQHPDFFQNCEGQWFYPRFNENIQKYLDWYSSYFSDAHPNQLVGEDSTTYIASHKTAKRIAKFNPEAKIIIMLRDPASRTYSHYWHLVRSGRALWSFEKTLQIMPDNLIERSLYKNQIEIFLNHIPRENIHFIVLEKFSRDMSNELSKVCRFIGVTPDDINLDKIKTHSNLAKIPKNLSLQLWRNRVMRLEAKQKYNDHLVDIPNSMDVSKNPLIQWLDRMHKKANPLHKKKPPQMEQGTRLFLDNYYKEANQGLEELIGQETTYWYKSQTN